MHLLALFTQWKKSKKTQSPQLFKMISILNRIYINKSKRVFNPPRIVKDSDEIRTRALRKLRDNVNWILRRGVIKWKYFKANEIINYREEIKEETQLGIPFNVENPRFSLYSGQSRNSIGFAYEGEGNVLGRLSINYDSLFKTLENKSQFLEKPKAQLTNMWGEYSKAYAESIRILKENES